MADDSAALVVELVGRFDKFDKALQDLASSVDKQTKRIEDSFDRMTKVIAGKLQAIQGTLIAPLGVLGQALSVLGPGGIAAAVGLGALVAALNATAEAAERVGQKAIAIREFSVATGLTAEQVQGLRKAMNVLGVDSDQALRAFELFSVQLNELRQTGGGPLAEALNKVDKNLLGVMLRTQSTAEAFQVFIRALSQVSTEQRNAAARAVGGRGGIEAFAEMATESERFFAAWKKGTEEAKPAEEVKKVADQARLLTALQKEASSNWDKLFPTSEFMRLKQAELENYISILKTMQQGAGAFFQDIMSRSALGQGIKKIQEGGVKGLFTESGVERLPDAFDAVRRKADLLTEQNKALADSVKGLNQETKTAAATQSETAASAAAATAARQKELATVIEQIDTLRKLKSVSAGAFTQAQETQLQKLILRQRELDLALDPAVTAARVRGEKDLTDAYNLQAIALKERLGIATLDDIETAKRIELQKAAAEGVIDNTNKATAAFVSAKQAKEAFDRQLLQRTNFPGLTQMAIDLADVSKQLDQLGTSSINAFVDNMADAVTGAKSIQQAFTDMANSILKDMARIAIRQAIVKPLLSSIGIPGLMAGGTAISGKPYIVGEAGPELFVPNQTGTVIPNNKLGNISIGAPSTTVNVQGGADRTTIAMMRTMLAERDRRFVADVARATHELRRRSVFA